MQSRPPPSKRSPAPSLAARALRLLARRDHTRVELERKLAPHVEDGATLQGLLDDFTARGWLSEARVVEELVHAQRKRLGPERIRQALLQKGVVEELIAPALRDLKDTELETARAVWSRKFKTLPQTAAERARQVRFLQSRGFSIEIALRAVRSRGAIDGD